MSVGKRKRSKLNSKLLKWRKGWVPFIQNIALGRKFTITTPGSLSLYQNVHAR